MTPSLGHLQHRNSHFRKPNHKLFTPPSLQKCNPTFSNCFTPPPNASSHSSPLPLFSWPQFPNLTSSHPLPPFVDFVIVQKTLNYTLYPYTWSPSTEFPPLPFLLDVCLYHFLCNPFNTGTAIMLSSLKHTQYTTFLPFQTKTCFILPTQTIQFQSEIT